MPTNARNWRRSAFSLLELVVVVVVIGIVTSIAVTRVGAAAENSRIANLTANLVILDKAVQMYIAEHDERGPATEPDGTTDADVAWLIARLVGKSDSAGRMGPGYPFGPYLGSIPRNPMNGRDTVRIDGPLAGRNAAGWRFDSATNRFQADDSDASAAIKLESAMLRGTIAASADAGAVVDDENK